MVGEMVYAVVDQEFLPMGIRNHCRLGKYEAGSSAALRRSGGENQGDIRGRKTNEK